jgi:hypothetical protein
MRSRSQFDLQSGARNVVNALNTEAGHAIIATTDHTGPLLSSMLEARYMQAATWMRAVQ